MKNVFKFALLCAMMIVLFGCDDIFGSKSDDTPNTGGEIKPNPGDEQESVDFDVTYTEDFTDGEREGKGYDTNYTHSFGSNGVTLTAKGQTEQTVGNYAGTGITLRDMRESMIEVKGIKGLGTVTINYNLGLKIHLLKAGLIYMSMIFYLKHLNIMIMMESRL